MKFILKNTLAFVAFSYNALPSVQGTYCGTIPQTTYAGIAKLVNVDNSEPQNGPTMGDVSIAEAIVPVNNSEFSNVSIKAICTLTADNPQDSAPFCTFESTVTISTPGGPYLNGKTMAMGTPPLLSIMGGMEDFMGAYGQFDTLNSLSIIPNPDGTSNLQFDAIVSFCVPDDQPPTGGGPSPPAGSPIVAPCVDSPTWRTVRTNREKDCNWVAINPSIRCAKMGIEKDKQNMFYGGEISAYESCQMACTSCV